MASASVKKNRKMFVGAIINSIGPKEVEYIPDAVMVICEKNIAFLQNNANNAVAIQNQYEVEKENVHRLEKGQFLIPGFIDTHIHGSQYPNIGLGYNRTLLDWLQKYTFPLEKKFADKNFAERVYNAVVKRTLANGTTTAVYFATIHKESCSVFANCIKNLGQRAFVGKVNMNRNSPPGYSETYEGSLASTRDFIHSILKLNSDLVKPIITPRFALSCDATLLKALGQLASEFDLLIQTHISENKDEVRLVKREFPSCKNYLDVYSKAGLVNDKTILAHGIYLEPDEVSEIVEKKATISHCPNSNVLLRSGVCPVRQYLDAGMKVTLGTDCSGGNTCSVLESIRQALFVSTQLSLNNPADQLTIEELFFMATLGGAQALHLENVTGNFMVGKEFDAILVDLNNNNIDLLEEYSLSQLFQKFIYLGDDRSMKKVFVAGKQVKNQ